MKMFKKKKETIDISTMTIGEARQYWDELTTEQHLDLANRTGDALGRFADGIEEILKK